MLPGGQASLEWGSGGWRKKHGKTPFGERRTEVNEMDKTERGEEGAPVEGKATQIHSPQDSLFEFLVKPLWKPHGNLLLLKEALPLALHALVRFLGSLAGSAEIPRSVREAFPLYQGRSMSRKHEASSTGSGDIWQEPLPTHVHTHARDLWRLAWGTESHPGVQAPSRARLTKSLPPSQLRPSGGQALLPLCVPTPNSLDIWMTDHSFEGAQRRVFDMGTLGPCVIKDTFSKIMWVRLCSS